MQYYCSTHRPHTNPICYPIMSCRTVLCLFNFLEDWTAPKYFLWTWPWHFWGPQSNLLENIYALALNMYALECLGKQQVLLVPGDMAESHATPSLGVWLWSLDTPPGRCLRTLRGKPRRPQSNMPNWRQLTLILCLWSFFHLPLGAGTGAEVHVRAQSLKSQPCREKTQTGSSRELEDPGVVGREGLERVTPTVDVGLRG